MTEEHVFPDSLGGQLITRDVCKECNDYLGENVDSHLVNHMLMQFTRAKYRLRGKKGHIPNPLSKGVLKDEPERLVNYKFDKDGNSKSLYLVPEVKKSTDGKSIKFSVDGSDKEKLFEMVKKTLKRNNMPGRTIEEIEEMLNSEKIDRPEVIYNLEADLNSYRKAILKIIYEFTYIILGKKYLEDPLSEKIREYIKSDSLDIEGLIGDVNLVNKETPRLEVFSMLAIENGHIACIIPEGNNIFCYVNLFNQFEGYLVVSEEASRYKGFEAVFYENDVENKTYRKSRYVDKISERFN